MYNRKREKKERKVAGSDFFFLTSVSSTQCA